jgi:hypothetical protein
MQKKLILVLFLIIALIHFTAANGAKDFVKNNIVSPVVDTVSGVPIVGDALNELGKLVDSAKKKILDNAIPDDKQSFASAVMVQQNAWIGKNYEALKQMKLKELLLPASHDSGCYDLS